MTTVLIMIVVMLIFPLPLADSPPMIGFNVVVSSSMVDVVGVVSVEVAKVVGTLVFMLVRLDSSVFCLCDEENKPSIDDTEGAGASVSKGVVMVGFTDIRGCAGMWVVVGMMGGLDDG